ARPLLVLGAISYAVYLFHPTLLDLLRDLPGIPRGPVFVLVTLLAVPLVGWLVHRVLERPAIGLGRRLTGAGDRSAHPGPLQPDPAHPGVVPDDHDDLGAEHLSTQPGEVAGPQQGPGDTGDGQRPGTDRGDEVAPGRRPDHMPNGHPAG